MTGYFNVYAREALFQGAFSQLLLRLSHSTRLVNAYHFSA